MPLAICNVSLSDESEVRMSKKVIEWKRKLAVSWNHGRYKPASHVHDVHFQIHLIPNCPCTVQYRGPLAPQDNLHATFPNFRQRITMRSVALRAPEKKFAATNPTRENVSNTVAPPGYNSVGPGDPVKLTDADGKSATHPSGFA